LSWFKRDLSAAGREYRFYFELDPSVGDTRKVTAVVETWEAGA
jgi:hypothetical protein